MRGLHRQFNMDSGNLDVVDYTYAFVIVLKYGGIQFTVAVK